MSEGFDPYLQWLGIRDPERPPNAYRLLGIELFEPEADIIANAADRQMTHVRSFAIGPRREECQTLLNELAAARIKLLNLAKKAKYDEELALAIGYGEEPIEEPTVVPIAEPLAAIVETPALDFEIRTPAHRPAKRPQKSQTPLAPFAILGVLIAIAVVIGLKVKQSGMALAPQSPTQVAQEPVKARRPDRRDQRPPNASRPSDRNRNEPRPIPDLNTPRELPSAPAPPDLPLMPAPKPQIPKPTPQETTPPFSRPANPSMPAGVSPDIAIGKPFGKIVLPSGAVFSDELAVISLDAIRELFKDESLKKTTSANAAGRVEAIICYNDDGLLHGPLVVFQEEDLPRGVGYYRDANRWGVRRLWDDEGRRRLVASYKNGNKDGLYVLFHDDLPRWIEEYDLGKLSACHLVNFADSTPSVATFASRDEALLDDLAKEEIARVDVLDNDMANGERALRKSVTAWHDKMVDAQRRAFKASTASARRELTRQRDQIYSDMQRASDAALDSMINGTHGQVRRQYGS